MTELGTALVDELEALAPYEPVEGRWDDVARRAGLRRRRRPLVVPIAAVLVLVIGLGTAANAALGWRVSPFWSWFDSYPPGRTGPIVTVLSGPDWNFVAWKSTNGICTSYGGPGASGSGCSNLPRAVVALDSVEGLPRSRARIIGNASARVSRVEVIVGGRRPFVARLSRSLPQLGTTRRFFVAEGPVSLTPGHETPFVLVAYDSRGCVIARVR